MWIWIANKSAKFHAKRLNRSEDIPKRFRGGATFFLKHPCRWHAYEIDDVLRCCSERATVRIVVGNVPWIWRSTRRSRRCLLVWRTWRHHWPVVVSSVDYRVCENSTRQTNNETDQPTTTYQRQLDVRKMASFTANLLSDICSTLSAFARCVTQQYVAALFCPVIWISERFGLKILEKCQSILKVLWYFAVTWLTHTHTHTRRWK